MSISFKLTSVATKTHFDLFYRLKQLGFDVWPEVKFSNRLRADLVVFKKNEIVCVIEAKGNRSKGLNGKSKQAKKYRELPYPVTYCCGIQDIDRVVELIIDLVSR